MYCTSCGFGCTDSDVFGSVCVHAVCWLGGHHGLAYVPTTKGQTEQTSNEQKGATNSEVCNAVESRTNLISRIFHSPLCAHAVFRSSALVHDVL